MLHGDKREVRKADRESRRERLSQQEKLAYGRHPVAEAMRQGDVERIWLLDSGVPDRFIADLVRDAERCGIPVRRIGERYFRSRIGGNPHQGVMAQVKPFKYATISELSEAACDSAKSDDPRKATVLMLDGLDDPGNFGSVLRTSAGLGIAGVVISERRSVGITAAVRKTSAGTAGRIPIARARSIPDAIKLFRNAGWSIVGASVSGNLLINDLQIDKPVALVMGGEHKGLSREVESLCNNIVRIPMANDVESLNVAAAAAILLSYIVYG